MSLIDRFRRDPVASDGVRRDTAGRMEPVVFDARPVIAAGREPFDGIMAAVASLVPGQEFVVLAPFEPVPLEGVLGSQGFGHEAEEIGGGDWKVTFRSPA